MSLELFVFLAAVVIIVGIGWGADRQWRREHGEPRDRIKPMSDEEIRINEILASRRRK